MKRWLIFTLIVFAHFAAGIACAMAEFHTSSFLPPFDTADPSHEFWATMATVLTMPAALVAGRAVDSTFLSGAILLLNSLLWVGVMYSVAQLVIGRLRRRPEAAHTRLNLC